VDHRLAVWLEIPGQEIPEELCGYYHTTRHWIDLTQQLERDLLARKLEVMPERAH